MTNLNVFVSSTCYDLSQIRADMYDFISSLGYRPFLSEYASFPIDPDADTISNCIDNVKAADVFVLIIGNRYGYVTDTGKSITNTEYLYAKRHGIPTYIFILKSLIPLIPFWKSNKDYDFSQSVDSSKIFEFIDHVRSVDKSWTFEFERAQDIANILKIQFAHLFKSSLQYRNKFVNNINDDLFNKISSNAVNLLIKKDEFYEMLFFVQVLEDELENHEGLKLDFEYQILTRCNSSITEIDALTSWLGIQIQTIQHFINSLTTLFDLYKKYYADNGVPSDLKGLYYVAFSIAKQIKELLLWSIDIQSTHVPEEFITILDSLSKLGMESIQNIWDYPNIVRQSIEDALYRVSVGETNIA